MKNGKSQMFTVLRMLLAVSLLLALPAVALAADSYPSKPVRLIITMAPGGGNDIVGRIIAAPLTEKLGQQVVVENHGGAGGIIGTELVARAKPDGYTLLLVPAGHATHSAFYSKLRFDPEKSFAPVAKLGTGMITCAVYPGLPVKSIKELIALAKAKPGDLNCASPGAGNFAHLGGELFQMMSGTKWVTVHFKGGSATQTDVIGGHSQLVFNGLVTLLPYIKSGQLRALGVGGKKRSVLLPDVPTISEVGVPGYEANNFFGIHAPAGTPQAIVDRLNKEISVILASAQTRKVLLSQAVEPDYMDPTEFGKFLHAETVKWTKVIKDAGIKIE
jgi:tripartite-type tricarboxylate transporter receptor subunit TctC